MQLGVAMHECLCSKIYNLFIYIINFWPVVKHGKESRLFAPSATDLKLF